MAPSGARLADFRDLHQGETVLVCGCGESLNLLTQPERFVTIGVNDVGRRFTPDYLVVMNPPSQFSAGRFRYVERSQAKALFTQLTDLGVPHSRLVRFQLGSYGGTDLSNPDKLPYTQNSPYVAVCLAVQMGARRIGLIGVDFTDHHFFARTGRHGLASRLEQINREYVRLGAACRARGVELVNLSPTSRLTALPRMPMDAFAEGVAAQEREGPPATTSPARRVFFVNYRFLACGDVFTDGLRHAAEEVGVECSEAYWDDPGLPSKVARFAPDLVMVVHGRNFARRWGHAFAGYRTAVWLVDEPYEVDDSSTYSRAFTHVFLNDPATLGRHHSADYLAVCYNPRVHFPSAEPKRYSVGFVGGANATRERLLGALAQRGLLGYVVGGPWRDGALKRLCLAPNLPAEKTAALYRATKIVVNVFRDVHHFNRHKVAPVALNPRVYEALACGALVVSEARPEAAELVPEMPTFTNERELVALVEGLLADPGRLERVRAACAARLKECTYGERLRRIMILTIEGEGRGAASSNGGGQPQPEPSSAAVASAVPPPEWELCDDVDCQQDAEALVLRKAWDGRPGAERGVVSCVPYETTDLSFEVLIASGSSFIAKIGQVGKLDQATNSYHLYSDDRGAYLARHNRVFRNLQIARGRWERLRLTNARGVLSVYAGDRLLHRVRDHALGGGYAFVGLKGGEVRLRDMHLSALVESAPASVRDAEVLQAVQEAARPRVSIVTTVYDRPDCLRRCIRSVRKLAYRDYEHLVVSDGPPPPLVDEIARIVREEGDERTGYLNLNRRFNNWGIAPAAAGLRQSRGELVSFLSDDNGYLPGHIGALVAALDRDPRLGFAYSSCLYDGRIVLRHPVPRPGGIDLGQPLFRRELFELHLGDDLPFNVIAWDWALIDALLRRGVRWKHVDTASFVFRLAKYPHLVAA